MAETVDEAVDLAEVQPPTTGLCLCEQYVRVTEGGALTAARWLGRADQEAAEGDAAAAMRAVLDDFPIRGRVVIGSAMEDSPLRAGDDIGAGGDTVDLALDPLEGRGVVARGGNGAMSMIAVGDPGRFTTLPDIYMRKMAVGPRARGDLRGDPRHERPSRDRHRRHAAGGALRRRAALPRRRAAGAVLAHVPP